MVSKIDREKMREFVEEALEVCGGEIVSSRETDEGIQVQIAGVELTRIEDFVNQRLGHYAYPWTSWVSGDRTLELGMEEYED